LDGLEEEADLARAKRIPLRAAVIAKRETRSGDEVTQDCGRSDLGHLPDLLSAFEQSPRDLSPACAIGCTLPVSLASFASSTWSTTRDGTTEFSAVSPDTVSFCAVAGIGTPIPSIGQTKDCVKLPIRMMVFLSGSSRNPVARGEMVCREIRMKLQISIYPRFANLPTR